MAHETLQPDDPMLVAVARLAVAGVATEYPNKPADVVAGPEGVRSQRAAHPAFYGCFDWHSAVHTHWTLVRLLRLGLMPGLEAEVRAAVGARLRDEPLRVEAAYFREARNRSYERMYGWAWLLRLAAELRGWDDAEGTAWARALAPLEGEIVSLAIEYLPRLAWPIRSGAHKSTAFALAQMHDHARAAGAGELEGLIAARAIEYFAGDTDAPIGYEPSGEDFLSPALAEADLMRRVMDRGAFGAWLDGFLPGLRRGSLGPLGRPIERVEMDDGMLGHLAGLNLSRAWAMRGVASALDAGDPRRAALEGAASAHLSAGLARVESGRYEGEHWLGTFAVYALTGAGLAA